MTAPEPGAAQDDAVPTDRELLAAHVAGDAQAMNELFRRHRPMLWRLAWHLMRQHEDAEDLTQIALMRATAYAATYAGISTVRSWLRTILINACYLELDRRARLPYPYGSTADLADGAAVPVEPDQVPAVDLRLALQEAVEKLPEVNRTVFYLTVMRGLSEAQTARALGIPAGTVKSRKALARALLARELSAFRSHQGNTGASS